MSGISKQEFNQFKAQLMAQLCELKTCGSCCDNKEEKLVREVTVSGNTFFVTYNDGTVKTFTIGSNNGPNPVFVTNIDVTPAGYLVFYSDGTTEILSSNSSDELVKISSSDTNSKFLEDALTIKGNVGLTDPMIVKLNSGANEELEINIPKVIVENTIITYSQADINSILKFCLKKEGNQCPLFLPRKLGANFWQWLKPQNPLQLPQTRPHLQQQRFSPNRCCGCCDLR